MQCIICGSSMNFYFTKEFHAYGLGKVEYWQCENCGFTASKTHAELTDKKLEEINYKYHTSYQGTDYYSEDPNWIARLHSQSTVLRDAVEIGLLSKDGRWLDYACGDGKFSAIVKSEHGLNLFKYDRFMPRQEGFLGESSLTARGFDLVITTSVFEHFTRREEFNFVESLLSRSGVLGIHTLVCEKVPADPSWFYLWPVHCAFHTNKSMSILFQQWGFSASVYHVESRLWLWFRIAPRNVEAKVKAANARPNGLHYEYKEGFVDYWK